MEEFIDCNINCDGRPFLFKGLYESVEDVYKTVGKENIHLGDVYTIGKSNSYKAYVWTGKGFAELGMTEPSSEQLDKIKEISERYKQLFIREFINTDDPDDKTRHRNIRDLTKFVSAGAEAVLNSYLREMHLDNRYSSQVTISANMHTKEVRFNVHIHGICSDVGKSIEILTGIANQCTGSE